MTQNNTNMDFAKDLYKLINKDLYFDDSFLEDCCQSCIPPDFVKNDIEKYSNKITFMKLEEYTRQYNELMKEKNQDDNDYEEKSFTNDATIFLGQFAYQSSPLEYRKLQKRYCDIYFEYMIKHPYKGDCDRFIADLYLSQSKCVKFFNKCWYVYDLTTGIYRKYDEDDYIFKSVSQDLDCYIEVKGRKILEKYADDNEVEMITNMSKKDRTPEQNTILLTYKKMTSTFESISKKLGNSSTLSGIITAIKKVCSTLSERFDCNMDLFGFKNGVFSLKEFRFRRAEFSDNISMTCGWNFPIGFDPVNSPIDADEIKMNNILSKSFTDLEDKIHFIRQIPSAMWGKSGRFLFITKGGASNGKSLLFMSLCEPFFGDYFVAASQHLIFGKTPKGATNEDLMAMKCKRFAITSEPSNCVLNCGEVKRYTGKDVLEGRGIFEKKSQFICEAQFNILTNDNIIINDKSEAMTSRILYTPMSSKFYDITWFNENVGKGKLYESYEECAKYKIFPKDIECEAWIKTEPASQAFLKIILRQLHKDKVNNDNYIGYVNYIPSSTQLMSSNEEMKDTDNHFQEFIKLYFDVGLDQSKRVKTSELHSLYDKFIKISNSLMSQYDRTSIPLKRLGNEVIKQKLSTEYKIVDKKSSVFYYLGIALKPNVNAEYILSQKYRPVGQSKVCDELDEPEEEIDIKQKTISSQNQIASFFVDRNI